MINIHIKVIDEETVEFDFDHAWRVEKRIYPRGLSSCSDRAYRITLAYCASQKMKEAIRDFLYHHRGAFGSTERHFEKVLFRLAGN